MIFVERLNALKLVKHALKDKTATAPSGSFDACWVVTAIRRSGMLPTVDTVLAWAVPSSTADADTRVL